jgi:hypothetical protein
MRALSAQVAAARRRRRAVAAPRSPLMRARSSHVAALCLALGAAAVARADERYDHRGAVGVLVGSGGEWLNAASGPGLALQGFRLDVDLGGTYAIGDNGNELMLLGRAIFGGPSLEGSLILGYRGYFGQDEVKTFFDAGVAGHLMPELAVGPRLGFGVQYEFSPLVGAYAGIGGQVALGQTLRFDFELCLGLQVRTYILE